MDYDKIIAALAKNGDLFKNMLEGLSRDEYLWKPAPEKWCLLEVVCHLFDEEREDFWARTKHVLETPDLPMKPIYPATWVASRKYSEQDYASVLEKFLAERAASVQWLRSLKAPAWGNSYQHPELGTLTARLFLVNWLDHDYLHIRQILSLKHGYLGVYSGEGLFYAAGE